MKILRNPVIAVILSLALMFGSSVFSTRVKLLNSLNAGSTEAYAAAIESITKDASRFPGSVFIPCSGIKIS